MGNTDADPTVIKNHQKVFDRVAAKLVEQARPSVGFNGLCVYDDGAGRRCAIGHLMTRDDIRELRRKELLTKGLDKLPDKLLRRLLKRHNVEYGFLKDIQLAHDTSEHRSGQRRSWKAIFAKNMRGVARAYGLSTGVLRGVR